MKNGASHLYQKWQKSVSVRRFFKKAVSESRFWKMCVSFGANSRLDRLVCNKPNVFLLKLTRHLRPHIRTVAKSPSSLSASTYRFTLQLPVVKSTWECHSIQHAGGKIVHMGVACRRWQHRSNNLATRRRGGSRRGTRA